MQCRRAWWVGLLMAAAACLVLLPLTRAVAGAPHTTVGGKDNGIALVSEENDLLRVTYPRSNYLWPYATGPFYGEVDPSQWASPGVLHFAVGSFDTQRGMLPFPAELRTTVKFDRQASQYFVLQMDPAAFTDGRFDSLRERIIAAGGMFMGPVPVGAFVVRLNAGALSAIRDSRA